MRKPTYLAAYLLFSTTTAQQNCYRPTKPFHSSCTIPNLWAMREQLCNSDENWGEGFPFLSGHGLNIRMTDNCTADNNPDGIRLGMTISSTVKDRDDCWNRTKHIIEDCVVAKEATGGEWYDLEEPDKTLIYLEVSHIDPPPPPNPCYEYPPPPFCTDY